LRKSARTIEFAYANIRKQWDRVIAIASDISGIRS